MDHIDQKILNELQIDGRITQEELAKRLGLSRASAGRRLTALLANSGFRVIGLVHPAILGLPIMAHVSVNISGQIEEIGRQIAQDSRIPFVSVTAGSMSLVAEIRVSNQKELQDCIDQIREIRGVTSLRSSTYTQLEVDILRTLHVEQLKVDALDLALLDIIRIDGRATFAGLAEAVGVSTGTARTRTLKMLDAGIVRIGTMWQPEAQPHLVRVGMGISIQSSSTPLLNRIAQIPGITFLASGIGRHDLLATVHGTTFEDVIVALSKACDFPGVQSIETWVHLKVLKEQH